MRANDLQQHNIQKTKTILLQCKNPLFARQKPYFCTPKTILLHAKNHTFVLRICNIHRMNTLQTFRKISTFNYEIPNEHSAKYQRTPPKHPTYTPPGVGDRFIVPVFFLCQIRIFTSSNTCIRFIANTFLFVILWIYTDMRAR